MSEIHYYPPGPVAAAFMASNAFVRGLMGPVGSGKSVTCCMEIMRRACEQEPDINGKRRTRWVIIRNTYPELKSTTIKTWLEWFPEDVYGKMNWSVPFTQYIELANDIEIEVLFLALDRPDHVKKLLSLEVTGGWINEARELPKAILDALTGRCGRFPSQKTRPAHIAQEHWPTWTGVVMDTNPPDDEHWWAKSAEGTDEELLSSTRTAEVALRAEGLLKEDQPLIAFFRQPSGLSPKAENLPNLRSGYYTFACVNKREDWIKVYVRAEYGSIMDGKPVYPQFNSRLHVSEKPLRAMPGVPIRLGWDFGLTPACIVTQLTPRGQFRVLQEFIAEGMGVQQFAKDVVIPQLRASYPEWTFEWDEDAPEWKQIKGWGDPAGSARADTDERTCFQALRQAGLETKPTKTNAPIARVGAVESFLIRLVDGEPAFLIDKSCKVLIKGFNGGYQYRKMLVPGEERFTETPDKNRFSHPHDALQYVALGHLGNPGNVESKDRAKSRRAHGYKAV